jgi:hypothetical protein
MACLLLAGLFYGLTARELRRALPDVWHELGEPSGTPFVGTFRQFDAGVRLVWFLLTERRAVHSNARLRWLVWAYRLAALAVVLLAVLTSR